MPPQPGLNPFQPLEPTQPPGNDFPFPSTPMFPPSSTTNNTASSSSSFNDSASIATTTTNSSSSFGSSGDGVGSNTSTPTVTTAEGGGEGRNALVQPLSTEECAGLTTSPDTNMLVCMTESLATSFTNPTIQQYKDSEYMPPSNQEELLDKCTAQATSSNINPNSYCAGLFQHCVRDRLTVEECYAHYFVNEDLWNSRSVPNDISTSISQKQAASQAGLQRMQYTKLKCVQHLKGPVENIVLID